MTRMDRPVMGWDEARTVLGVPADADAERVRHAYLEQVRLYPPDKEPDRFERIRDAYDLLKDPRARAQQVLSPELDLAAPLTDLLKGRAGRQFVGPDPWLDVLKERRP